VISDTASRATARLIDTDEELMVAKTACPLSPLAEEKEIET